MLELDRTKIALENATNNLMALQHKQFVENRVYDDDETLANVDNVPVTDTNPSDKVIFIRSPSFLRIIQLKWMPLFLCCVAQRQCR